MNLKRKQNDFEVKIENYEVRCKNYDELISKLNYKIENLNEIQNKIDIEDLKKSTKINKDTLNDNNYYQEIVDENNLFKKTLTD